jgi:hypothetical protein
MNYKKIVLKIGVSLIIITAVERFCYYKTAGFALHKIISTFPSDSRYDIASITEDDIEQVNGILNQKFYFLDKGRQAYAFISEDGQYVLKLLKCSYIRVPYLIKHLPAFGRLKQMRDAWIERRENIHHKTFISCKLSYEELKEETGLIFVHLNPVKQVEKPVQIIDRIGIAFTLDLNDTVFAIQKTAVLATDRLQNAIERKDSEQVEHLLDDLIAFTVNRSLKGIDDADKSGMPRNFGYIDGHIVQIDIGAFSKQQPPHPAEVIEQILQDKFSRLKNQLQEHFPDSLPFLEERIQTSCKSRINPEESI